MQYIPAIYKNINLKKSTISAIQLVATENIACCKSIPGASGIASPPWKSSVADACPTAAITRFSPIRTWVGSESFTHVNKNTLGWLTMEKLPSTEQPKYHWPKAGWSSSKWNIWLVLRNQTSEGTLWINILEKAQCKNNQKYIDRMRWQGVKTYIWTAGIISYINIV